MYKILIADDHPLMRAALKQAVAQALGYLYVDPVEAIKVAADVPLR